ncbi:MAG TPA: hypothetical protein VJQ81_06310 [Reyranella sp.]|jgi:hypothetical protein|nr:hypothetical protein [Reyranella sp.]
MDLETGMVAWSHYELLLPNRPPARIVVTLGDLQHESSVAQIARSSGATHFGLVSIANADGGMSQAIVWTLRQTGLAVVSHGGEVELDDSSKRVVLTLLRVFFRELGDLAPDLSRLDLPRLDLAVDAV